MNNLGQVLVEGSHALNQVLNTPMIADAVVSAIYVSFLRVLVAGTMFLALWRTIGMLSTLPKRRNDQTWAHYFKNPWWRTPAILIGIGMFGAALMLLLQALAKPHGDLGAALSHATPYFTFIYLAQWLMALGMALLAGEFRARMKNDQ